MARRFPVTGRALGRALAVGLGAAGVYHALIRPWHLRWGATDDDAVGALPGDAMSEPTPFRSTMATTIAAPPEDIWPWLVQMGWGRGGFYSHTHLENLFGMDLHNADRIHPEWQDLAVGDEVWLGYPRSGGSARTEVALLEPNRALVLALVPVPGGEDLGGSWSFVLDPVDSASTRLITRLQVHSSSPVAKLRIYAFFEPAHFVMQRAMLRGLAARVEAHGYAVR
jgi:hypothetical protein